MEGVEKFCICPYHTVASELSVQKNAKCLGDCPLLEDNLHKEWEPPSGKQGTGPSVNWAARKGAVPAGSSALVLLPPCSVGFQKPLRKCRPIHKPPCLLSEQHNSCPTAQARTSQTSPTTCLWRTVSRKQSFSSCSILCPSQSCRGAPVPLFLSGISAATSSGALPAPSLTLQPVCASCARACREGCHPPHRGSAGRGTLAWLVEWLRLRWSEFPPSSARRAALCP